MSAREPSAAPVPEQRRCADCGLREENCFCDSESELHRRVQEGFERGETMGRFDDE